MKKFSFLLFILPLAACSVPWSQSLLQDQLKVPLNSYDSDLRRVYADRYLHLDWPGLQSADLYRVSFVKNLDDSENQASAPEVHYECSESFIYVLGIELFPDEVFHSISRSDDALISHWTVMIAARDKVSGDWSTRIPQTRSIILHHAYSLYVTSSTLSLAGRSSLSWQYHHSMNFKQTEKYKIQFSENSLFEPVLYDTGVLESSTGEHLLSQQMPIGKEIHWRIATIGLNEGEEPVYSDSGTTIYAIPFTSCSTFFRSGDKISGNIIHDSIARRLEYDASTNECQVSPGQSNLVKEVLLSNSKSYGIYKNGYIITEMESGEIIFTATEPIRNLIALDDILLFETYSSSSNRYTMRLLDPSTPLRVTPLVSARTASYGTSQAVMGVDPDSFYITNNRNQCQIIPFSFDRATLLLTEGTAVSTSGSYYASDKSYIKRLGSQLVAGSTRQVFDLPGVTPTPGVRSLGTYLNAIEDNGHLVSFKYSNQNSVRSINIAVYKAGGEFPQVESFSYNTSYQVSRIPFIFKTATDYMTFCVLTDDSLIISKFARPDFIKALDK